MERMISFRAHPVELEKSFSFSSFDFNHHSSPPSLFSDDDGKDDDDDEHDEQDAYIEITLEPNSNTPTTTPTAAHSTASDEERYHRDKNIIIDDDDELELRISFTSHMNSAAFPGFSSSSTSPSSSSNNSATTTWFASSSSSETCLGNLEKGYETKHTTTTATTSGLPEDSEKLSDHMCSRDTTSGDENKRRVELVPVVNRLVNTILSALQGSSIEVLDHDDNGHPDENRRLGLDTGKVWLRKPPKAAANNSKNGSAIKLFFKTRSMNIGSILASFVKLKPHTRQGIPTQANGTTDQHNRSSSSSSTTTLRNYQRLIKRFNKWSVGKKPNSDNYIRNGNKKKQSSFRNLGKSRVLSEINYDSIKGLVDTVSANIGRKNRAKQTKSCPSSIKSSPIHRGVSTHDHSKIFTGDNSVQAAIAHCKRSFGQR